ncbi:NAD(P)-binding protein [Punctularia strigosozonata HHB-11173 SS5]|uniref:NAD(P)-binding protein n=1 Tax=Punctularia strigosozonata (strain HHB-11173) TaxID=741275 RepID=UPI0004416338|nr:NAD(P)-binding protein [Punctularia strigosozonata HHB-11173 SS5]EIN05949.1 NAD(P)-binding protein [Punctularia strigosozonata HHB-11173 SS5]
MPPYVYLVSGASRGIGLGLVKALADREDTVVFAGARNPSAAAELQRLAAAKPDKVHIVQLVSSDEAGNKAAVARIKSVAGRLDVVIANAGINSSVASALETPAEELRNHFEVNVVGTFILFRACYELLAASTSSPKFVMISSSGGSIATGAPIPLRMLPYGTSKAAENYLARKLHFEHEKDGLVVFPICPGPVMTDAAEFILSQEEMLRQVPYRSVDEVAPELLARVDEATRENSGGQFLDLVKGKRIEW